MLKKSLSFFALLAFVLAAVAAWADVEINEENFPDVKFRELLSEAVGESIDGSGNVLTDDMVGGFNRFDFPSYEIFGLSTLKGIEHFTALESLNCKKNELMELDLSANSALVTLDCSDNKLTELDLSANRELTWLDCSGNSLTALDLSKNGNLSVLKVPMQAEVTLPNGDNISMKDFQVWNTADGKYLLDLSRYEGKIESVSAQRSDNTNVPMDVSGGVYTFEPCYSEIKVSYTIGEHNALRLYIPNTPKDISEKAPGNSSEKDSGDSSEKDPGDSSGETPDEEEFPDDEETPWKLSVKLVNNTDADIYVALAGWKEDGEDDGSFTKGWYKVEAGKERNVAYSGLNGVYKFGFYANSGSKRIWTSKPGEAKYAGCFWIHPQKAFDTHNGESVDGGKQVNFRTLKVENENCTIKFSVKK